MKVRKDEILDIARDTIHTEMQALQALEQRIGDEFVRAVESILASEGKVIMTGMGKSGLIARKICATLSSTGTPSVFLHPAEAFHGDLGMISKKDVIIAISYSGESDEVLKLIPFIQSNGNLLIGISGNEASTLAKHSGIHLSVEVEREACILKLAPTTSTTAQLALGDALAVALMRLRNFTADDFARLHPGGSLGRRLLMTVGNVMRSNDLPIVAENCTTKDMIHTISKGGLGLLVVCEGDDILGVVTDGDLRRAMESREKEFFSLQASDIYSPNPKCIAEGEKLIKAEQMMTRHKVNSLLVVNKQRKFVGVIQIYDIKL